MKEKLVLITGATSGIGKSAATILASRGYKIVFIARDESKAKTTADEIILKTGNEEIQYLIADLSVKQEIRAVTDQFKSRYDRLDILINNAGGFFSRRKITADGFEYTFALNHLSYFQITLRLLEWLMKTPSSRIINVASEAQRSGHINFNDLMGEKKFNGVRAYCQSKLANLLFTYEMHKRISGTGITVNAVHPGVVRTNFGKGAKGIYAIMMVIYRPFVRSPEKGAETVVYLAESPEVEGISGKYFYDKKQISSNKESYNEPVTRLLWEVSLGLTDLQV